MEKFVSERISREAEILVNGELKECFPLFTPIEEMKWAEGWNPQIVYGDDVAPGMMFRTPGQFEGEELYNWIFSKYDKEASEILYTVFTGERIWWITVKGFPVNDHQCRVTVNYTYIALSEVGNQRNKIALEKMFAENLKDWEDAINFYLRESTATD